MANITSIIIYSLLLLLCAGISISTAIYDKDLHLSNNILFLELSLMLWLLTRIVYLSSSDSYSAYLFYDSDIPFVGFSAVALLLFTAHFYGKEKFNTPAVIGLLSIIPTISLVLLFFPEGREIIRSNVNIVSTFPESAVTGTRGPWFWINASFSYCAMAAGALITAFQYPRLPKAYRPASLAVLAGSVIVAVGSVFTINLSSRLNLQTDLTLVLCVLSSFLFYLSARKNSSLEMLYYARYNIINLLEDGIVATDNKDRVVFSNPAADRNLVMTNTDKNSKSHTEMVKSAFGKAKKEIPYIEDSGVDYYMPDGTVFNLREVGFFSKKGVKEGAVAICSNVTERRKKLKELEQISGMDTLTGLLNRLKFQQMLPAIDSAENLPLAVIAGDLNSLKYVNDVLGHHQGDIYIRKSAETLQSFCPPNAYAYRTGGDEFIVLAPRCDIAGANHIAEEINNRMKELGSELPYSPSFSLGVAVKDSMEQSIEDIIQTADDRLYEYKREYKKIHGDIRGANKSPLKQKAL